MASYRGMGLLVEFGSQLTSPMAVSLRLGHLSSSSRVIKGGIEPCRRTNHSTYVCKDVDYLLSQHVNTNTGRWQACVCGRGDGGLRGRPAFVDVSLVQVDTGSSAMKAEQAMTVKELA